MNTNQIIDSRAKLERQVYSALETYSNIHRGSGHNAEVSERLYMEAGDSVLDYLGISRKKYTVIFCSPRRAAMICNAMPSGSFRVLSSADVGLPVGLRAVAAAKRSLPARLPFVNGGGTARLVSAEWEVRAGVPSRFEAGTPAIISVIAFAEAIKLVLSEGAGPVYPVNVPSSAERILAEDEFNGVSGTVLLDKLREAVIGRNLQVKTTAGMNTYVHFDNGASTRTFVPVWEAVRQTWQLAPEGRQKVIRKADGIISDFLGAPRPAYDILYTSNTTEAINLAAENLSREALPGTVVLNSLLEHNSNDLPWRYAGNLALIRLGVDHDGFVNLNELEGTLKAYNEDALHGESRIRLVALSGASNVLGTFNDIKAISTVVHRFGARLLVDAAQMVAHRRVDMQEWGVDYLVFSAHKVYAPFGTGVLVCRKELLNFRKDELEFIRESGEENAGGIAGLAKSVQLLRRIGINAIHAEEAELTRYALTSMAKINGIRVYGIQDPDSPAFRRKGGVISFSLGNKMAPQVAASLGAAGLGVRSGCHCAHMLVKYMLGISPFLENFQRLIVTVFPKLNLPGIVRISFGIENTKSEVDRCLLELNRIAAGKETSGA